MRPALVVIAVAACGPRAPAVVVDDTLGGIEDELPGTCVDPAPSSTVATIRELGRDTVVVCATGAASAACRKIELATGAMVEPAAAVAAEPARDRPVVASPSKDLPVCAGAATCRSLAGAIYLTTVDAGVTHGRLYDPDGTPIVMIGGDDEPIDVRRSEPIRIAATAWAWLDATARVVALHDVKKRTRARIDLDVTDVPVGASDARGTPDGRIVIALGGTRYGDIIVVEPIEGVVTLRRARTCEAGG